MLDSFTLTRALREAADLLEQAEHRLDPTELRQSLDSLILQAEDVAGGIAHLHETTVTGLTDSIDFTIREADDLLTGLRSLREDLD